jgi:hypothetical protein
VKCGAAYRGREGRRRREAVRGSAKGRATRVRGGAVLSSHLEQHEIVDKVAEHALGLELFVELGVDGPLVHLVRGEGRVGGIAGGTVVGWVA